MCYTAGQKIIMMIMWATNWKFYSLKILLNFFYQDVGGSCLISICEWDTDHWSPCRSDQFQLAVQQFLDCKTTKELGILITYLKVADLKVTSKNMSGKCSLSALNVLHQVKRMQWSSLHHERRVIYFFCAFIFIVILKDTVSLQVAKVYVLCASVSDLNVKRLLKC